MAGAVSILEKSINKSDITTRGSVPVQNSAIISCSPISSGLGVYSKLLFDLGFFEDIVFFKKSAQSDESGYRSVVKPAPEIFPARVFLSIYGISYWKKYVKKYDKIHLTSPEFFHLVKYNNNMTGTVHDLQPIGEDISKKAYSYAFRKYMEKNYRFLDKLRGVVTISKETEKKVREHFPDLDPVTIHQWTDDSFTRRDKGEARTRLNLRQNAKIILNVSSSEPRKNLNILEKVLGILPEDYVLVHIGSHDPLLPDGKRILNIESVSAQEYPLFFNAADLLLSPSVQEGFGRPTIEAINSSLPIVLSDIPVNREILPGYGYLASPYNTEDYVEAVEKVMDMPDRTRNGLYSSIGDYYREERALKEYARFFQQTGWSDGN